MDESGAKPRLRNLLDHFSEIEDDRESWRVAHPLSEVLLLGQEPVDGHGTQNTLHPLATRPVYPDSEPWHPPFPA